MYKLTGVTKNYQKGRGTVAALQGVDIVISGGEWLAIQGPTGHGKTTLLQMLGGLDRPTSGIVDLDGQDLAQMRESQVTKVRATSIGFIFQTFNLVPTLSAQEDAEDAEASCPRGPGAACLRSEGAAARTRRSSRRASAARPSAGPAGSPPAARGRARPPRPRVAAGAGPRSRPGPRTRARPRAPGAARSIPGRSGPHW